MCARRPARLGSLDPTLSPAAGRNTRHTLPFLYVSPRYTLFGAPSQAPVLGLGNVPARSRLPTRPAPRYAPHINSSAFYGLHSLPPTQSSRLCSRQTVMPPPFLHPTKPPATTHHHTSTRSSTRTATSKTTAASSSSGAPAPSSSSAHHHRQPEQRTPAPPSPSVPSSPPPNAEGHAKEDDHEEEAPPYNPHFATMAWALDARAKYVVT